MRSDREQEPSCDAIVMAEVPECQSSSGIRSHNSMFSNAILALSNWLKAKLYDVTLDIGVWSFAMPSKS
jgi:hypothetical protein